MSLIDRTWRERDKPVRFSAKRGRVKVPARRVLRIDPAQALRQE
jgi:hypothetical protein